MSYTFATWDPSDGPTVRLLVSALARVFQAETQDVEWFLWKHNRSPWGPSIVTYAIDDSTSEIAAVRAFWRWQLVWRGRQYNTFQPCDSVTLRNHQRRGLFTGLTELALAQARSAGAEVLFNFPNANSTPGYVKMGWQPTAKLLTLCKPTRLARSLRHVLQRNRALGSRFVPTPPNVAAASHNDLLTYAALSPPETSQLSGARTPDLLLWRFGWHPHTPYIVAVDDTCGFVYRTGQRMGMRIVSIEDFHTTGPWSKLRALVHRVARDEDADALTVTITEGHEAARCFSRLGFLPVPSHGQLMVRQLAADLPPLGQPRVWALTGCDIDTH